MHSILGIDIGTTAIKFNLFSKEDYLILCSKKYSVPMKESNETSSTQAPQIILQFVLDGIQAIAKEYRIDALVFSTAMHSLIPVRKGQVGEMYLWSDKRAQKTMARFKQSEPMKAKHFYEATGTPIHAMSPFAKLLYFKEKEPDFFASVDQWIDIKAYLMHYFTGEYVVDYSIASATGLFNTETFSWDSEILSFVSVKEEQLPQAVDTDTVFAITSRASEACQLSSATKVYIGASDGTLASYASWIGTGQKISLTIGTSGAIRYLSAERKISESQSTFCYYLAKNQWVIGGATNNGGKTLEWASQLFYENQTDIFTEIPTSFKNSPIGAKQLVFLPYINGERAPLWDANVTGKFDGVTLVHRRDDFIRAICEGILFNLKYIHCQLGIQEKAGIALSGGFFTIPTMAIEAAAIFESDCVQSDYTEPSFGAVALVAEQTIGRKTNELETIAVDSLKKVAYQKSFEQFRYELDKTFNQSLNK